MATYYLKLAADGGNDSLAGTSPSTAWATWAKALGATGITGGDILYVAPGVYNVTSTVTVGGTYSSTAQIIGDTTSAQFPGMNAGLVVLTGWNAAKTTYSLGTNSLISSSGKSNLTFKSLNFNTSTTAISLSFTTCQNIVFEDCVFTNNNASSNSTLLMSNTSGALNGVIRRCVFTGGYDGIQLTGNNVSDTTTVQSSLFTGMQNNTFQVTNCGASVYNCTLINNRFSFYIVGVSTSFPLRIYNCIVANASTGFFGASAGLGITEDYNRICNVASPRTNVTAGSNSTTNTPSDLEFYQVYKAGGNFPAFIANTQNNINKNFGTSTGAPATDLFGVAWTGTTPDAGAITYNPINLVAPTLVYNGGNERNASTITIAPGSTSQSIELYLGATGLTASTSGLSARYNRTRTASVSIPLVARTIAQAWTAGGFAEVDATNMPGIYRLDLPDAALAAGADDVTIVVRGASGTNGAVMTVKLSSGGLTSAQTASAVWDASPAGYNDATTFGGVVNQIDQTVTSIDTEVQDIPSNVWDELKANHTIPNSFGDYLDTKVSTGADTSRIQLRQGPFLIKQNAIDSVITEVNQFLSTVPNIEMVLIDSSGGSVSVAGATLVMRVRNQAGTAVVNNVTPTVAYADGGVIRWSPNLSWTALGVTTAGTYRIVVERTMSGVTTTFGPFLVQLSSG